MPVFIGPLGLERTDPQLLGDRDLADGSGRAHLAAQSAVQLAPAHLRDHDRRPEPLEPGLEQGRLQHVGRADADALVALDATSQELILGDRAGGPDHARLEVLPHAAGEPRHREEEKPEQPREHQLAAADRRIGDFAGLARQKTE